LNFYLCTAIRRSDKLVLQSTCHAEFEWLEIKTWTFDAIFCSPREHGVFAEDTPDGVGATPALIRLTLARRKSQGAR